MVRRRQRTRHRGTHRRRATQLGGLFLSLLTKIGPKIIKKAIPVVAGLGVKAITAAVGKGVSSRRRKRRRRAKRRGSIR